MRVILIEILGVRNSLNMGRYLGLPSLVGREKQHIFNYVKDRLWQKLQAWRVKKLSRTSKQGDADQITCTEHPNFLYEYIFIPLYVA